MTRRGRVVVVLFVAGVVLLALWGTGALSARAGGKERPGRPVPDAQRTASVVVRPGDTLWGIAQQAEPGADPRRTVQRILKLNGLPDDTLVQPGQRLRVPAG
ncbi:LysM peptidoglycan-binding domain-containing protein [Actinomadura rupiterrae]|uniref:LysM peptidoglycan-binding domain-containing protein n=1 Tax=Actinomadura rupiterrae TaxID=559627 RepID=UPI0020A3C77B|nr:LysM domain-containing protein [Actinomadura rupiterrae]MCP2343858.1 nucleoid-associated protein YgaU [Actinomadura rupiterrae]